MLHCYRQAVSLLAMLMSLLFSLVPGALAEFQQVASSRVALDVPATFRVATRFAGFTDEQHSGATVIVLDFPAQGYAEVAAAMAPGSAEAAKRRITVESAGRLPRSDEHVYIRGRQDTPLGMSLKFILLVRDSEHAAMITLSVLERSVTQGLFEVASAERMLTTARLEKGQAPGPATPFTLGYLGPFKLAATHLGSAWIYTIDGAVGQPNQEKPIVIVAVSLDSLPIGEPLAIAADIVKQSKISDFDFIDRRRVVIAGMEGLEAIAEGRNSDGREMTYYQVILAGKAGGYYRILGEVRTEAAPSYIVDFRKFAEGFAPK